MKPREMGLREWLRRLAIPTVCARALVHGKPKVWKCDSLIGGVVSVVLGDGYELRITIPGNPGMLTRMFFARRLEEELRKRRRW